MSQHTGGRLRSYLELARPPALFTAAADSLAGWVWARTAHPQLTSLDLSQTLLIILGLIGISASVYAAGMTTNDLFDYEEDLRDRPQRPLPSGRVSRAGAWRVVITLQVCALLLGVALALGVGVSITESGAPILGVIGATICLTYLYNGPLKATLIGPLVMGLCRFGNFWIGGALVYARVISNEGITLGSTSAPDLSLGLALAGGTLIYVTALTALSRSEVAVASEALERRRGRNARFAAWALCLSALHPLSHLWGAQLGWGALSALLVAGWLARGCAPLLSGADTSPERVQRGVGVGIRGVALGNVALCLGLGTAGWVGSSLTPPHLLGLGVAGLILIMAWSAGRVARWFYAT